VLDAEGVQTDPMFIVSKEEFLRGIKAFEQHVKRDAMYNTATLLTKMFWGEPAKMADGLGVLLLTWNQAFYRYGGLDLDFDGLERCISNNMERLTSFRRRDIFSLSHEDERNIKSMFAEFLEALQIKIKGNRTRRSPVSAAKALHVLAPRFFPLWDFAIAEGYGCRYHEEPEEKYLLFCKGMKTIAAQAKDMASESGRSLLKLIDEYNFAKYTAKWI
jgi:hypothetical protein